MLAACVALCWAAWELQLRQFSIHMLLQLINWHLLATERAGLRAGCSVDVLLGLSFVHIPGERGRSCDC
jgi:hypothetical protein